MEALPTSLQVQAAGLQLIVSILMRTVLAM